MYQLADGLDTSVPAINVVAGSTPASENFIVRDGAIEPRPTLSLFNNNPQILGVGPVVGVSEVVNTVNTPFPIASGRTAHAVYNRSNAVGDWSLLSYVAASGIDDPPGLGQGEYWDYTQIYSAENDENMLYMAAGSYQTMYVTVADSAVFSSMTAAPRAKYVTALDNYVVAFNTREGSQDLIQRVRWNDRGSASSWTGGLSGFEDLLTMRGAGTRIMAQDNALVLFSDEEIWRGVPGNSVFQWNFAPYDQSRGAPYSWTVAQTPVGLMFLGKDFQVYLLPKGGGPSQPIGQRLQREIRTTIQRPERAWAAFDNTYGQYKLFYSTDASKYPQKAAFLDVGTGAWMPQSYDSASGGIELTIGREVQRLSSSATSWGGLFASGLTWGGLVNFSWDDMGANGPTLKVMMMGSSTGTLYKEDSTGTNDNGTAMPCRYRTPGLLADDPYEQKTVREMRLAYQSDSRSSVTASYSQTVGATSVVSEGLSLVTASIASQVIGDPYFGARYPTIELSSEGFRYRLMQMFVTYRRGGR